MSGATFARQLGRSGAEQEEHRRGDQQGRDQQGGRGYGDFVNGGRGAQPNAGRTAYPAGGELVCFYN